MSPALNIAQDICKPVIEGGPQGFPQVFGILGSGWVELTMVSLLTSLLIMALFHIFANFLRNQPLLAWTKFELFQVFASAGIFAFIGVIAVGMCQFDMGFLDASYANQANEHPTMLDVVNAYFTKLKTASYLLFYYLMYVVKVLNLLAKITWLSNPMGVGMNDSPLEGLGQVNGVMFFVVGGYFTSMLMLWLQMRIMEYMSIASLYYLLPFGMFFRTFEPTRKFGGTLIGIAITFFLFYPITIIFNDYIIYNGSNATGLLGSVEGAAANADAQVKEGNMLTPEQEQMRLIELRQKGMVGLGNIVTSVTNGALFLLKPIMLYAIAAVVLPVINFMVLVETARALTHMLGEEVDVSNLTRMI